MNTLRCRICGRGEAESIGQIPDSEEFSGQKISPPIKGGELWHCRDCGSLFRYPTLSQSEYVSLYNKLPCTLWVSGEAERNDIAIIYTYLKGHIGGSILDVGCYTGRFLESIPENFKKYGVEPSFLAAESAASKGINVLGKTLDEVDSGKFFDVVVSIDVIEHLLDVEKFLNQCLAHVEKNGLLIISTGNPSCFFWKRVFKSKFWYNLFSEHVTFPSYNYYLEFSKRHALQPPEQIRFRYMKMKFIKRLSILLQYVRFSFFRTTYQTLKKVCGISKNNMDAVSSVVPINLVGIFTDHHVIVFRKRGL